MSLAGRQSARALPPQPHAWVARLRLQHVDFDLSNRPTRLPAYVGNQPGCGFRQPQGDPAYFPLFCGRISLDLRFRDAREEPTLAAFS